MFRIFQKKTRQTQTTPTALSIELPGVDDAMQEIQKVVAKANADADSMQRFFKATMNEHAERATRVMSSVIDNLRNATLEVKRKK